MCEFGYSLCEDFDVKGVEDGRIRGSMVEVRLGEGDEIFVIGGNKV